MLNEVQKNNQTGKWVRFGLLITTLVGLFLVVAGVRAITKDLPPLEDDFSTPKLTPAPKVSLIRDSGATAPTTPPEKIYFRINGEEVEGTVLPQTSNSVPEVNAPSQGRVSIQGNKPSQGTSYADGNSSVELH